MKDTIIIKVQEDDKSTDLSVDTEVYVTERTKYSIINAVMQSLNMDVNWLDDIDVGAFAVLMHMAKTAVTQSEEATVE